MSILRQVHDLPAAVRGGAVAIGNFDGVHRGHARIIEQLLKRAAEVAGPAIVLTFDPPPARILRPQACPPPLTWVERKAELLASLGIDRLIAIPTTRELLQLSAQAFFDQVIVGELAARALVEGPNFYFGHNREGDVALLAQFAQATNMRLDVVEPLVLEGEMVSSSRVRQLVAAGDVGAARSLLTAPYRIRGLVTHGAGRGASLGYPTANLDGIDTLLPAHGVYAGVARLAGASWPAAVNIGPNPTFGEHASKVEAHLVGCHDALYGNVLELDFIARLRDVKKFAGVDELLKQIKSDVEEVERVVSGK